MDKQAQKLFTEVLLKLMERFPDKAFMVMENTIVFYFKVITVEELESINWIEGMYSEIEIIAKGADNMRVTISFN